MATVTGYTAERMKAIEDGTVVDGDIVGDNLILTKHDGTQINAGSVRGPQGVAGPIGSDLAVLAGVQIKDVGIAGQIRAGRQLALTDFTNMGLAAPLGLWNLSDASDASGNGRNLSTKGPVTFVPGINGIAATAAFFSAVGGQAFYIADSGAADPFRIREGTFGCWFRTAQRGIVQMLIDKYGTAAQQAYSLYVNSNNLLQCNASPDGSANIPIVSSITDVADDRWHFAVISMDATEFKLYVDGVCEASVNGTFFFPGSSPFNIGARGVTAAAAGSFQHLGRIDEVFITPEILTEDEIRNLYCAKIMHTLAAVPKRASITVNRQRRGAGIVTADFPAQPLRMHNFSAGSLADQGSQNVVLVATGGPVGMPGSDGSANNAMNFTGTQWLGSTDNALPAGLNSRSYGCWFKTVSTAAGTLINIGGTALGTGDARVGVSAGNIFFTSGADAITGPFVADGKWHHAVVVEDNTAADGVKRKLYVDGKLVATSNTLNAIVLNGANRFTVGAAAAGASQIYTGQADAVFVTSQALTMEQINALYNKPVQALPPSPKNVGDHVEAFTSTSVLAIFDTLDMQHTIDLAVAA